MSVFTKEQAFKLNSDKVFQQRVKDDQILSELWARRISEDEAIEENSTFLGASYCLANNIYIDPPAMLFFVVLDAIDSPFLNPKKDYNKIDVDIAIRLLIEKDTENIQDLREQSIIELALGTCEQLDLDYYEMIEKVQKIIRLSLCAYEMLPAIEKGGGRNSFNPHWVTSIVSKVHKITGYSFDDIMYKIPFCRTAYFVVQAISEGRTPVTCRMTNEDKIFERLHELMKIRLEEL